MPMERSCSRNDREKLVLTLPGAEVQTSVCDRDHNRRSHKRCFRMGNPKNELRRELARTPPILPYESLGIICQAIVGLPWTQRTHSGPSSVCRQFKLSGTM